MITVRFPTGFSVQYNDATYVHRGANFHDLYTQKDGQWIAQAPLECIVEVRRPCRTYNAMRDPASVLEAALQLAQEARSGRDYEHGRAWASLKRALIVFNAKHRSWR